MENTLIFHTLARVLPVHYAHPKAYIRLMYAFRNTLMRIGEHVHFRHANVYMFATQMCTLLHSKLVQFCTKQTVQFTQAQKRENT